MSLSTLPLVVLDTLTAKLDLRSLLALSLTSKSLHHIANRVLYREPAFRWFECYLCHLQTDPTHHCASKALEENLSTNPTNAFFLRKYKTFKANFLQKIWSQSRLELIELYFSDVWFTSSNDQEIMECLDAKNREICVYEIVIDWPTDDDYRGLLGRLQSFNGLSVLRIEGPRFDDDRHSTPDSIIRQLHCPQLEQLHLSLSDLIPSIGDNLPNLNVLTISRNSPYPCIFCDEEEEYYNLDEKWTRLSALKSRGIHFAQRGFLELDSVSLLQFVFLYTHTKCLDATSMVEWLLVSHHVHQVRKSYFLDLYGFSVGNRDKSLKIMKSLTFEQDYTVALEIHTHDTPSIIHHFSDSISDLKILVPAYHRVKPEVVLAIIQALPKLREIEIWLCVGGSESGQIGRNATCLATNFEDNLPVSASHDQFEDKNLLHYILTVVRNGAAWWTVTKKTGGDDETRDSDIEFEFVELENKVMNWLQLNPSLFNIEIVFDRISERNVAGGYYATVTHW